MVTARHGQPVRLPNDTLTAATLEELQAVTNGQEDDGMPYGTGQRCGIMSTLYIHTTLYIIHTTLYIIHSTLYVIHTTLYIIHTTLYSIHTTLYSIHSTLYIIHTINTEALQAALLASLEDTPYVSSMHDDEEEEEEDEALKLAIEASLREAAPASPAQARSGDADEDRATPPAYYMTPNSPEEPTLASVRRAVVGASSVPTGATTTPSPPVAVAALPSAADDVRHVLQRDSLSGASGDEAHDDDDWGLQHLRLNETK